MAFVSLTLASEEEGEGVRFSGFWEGFPCGLQPRLTGSSQWLPSHVPGSMQPSRRHHFRFEACDSSSWARHTAVSEAAMSPRASRSACHSPLADQSFLRDKTPGFREDG